MKIDFKNHIVFMKHLQSAQQSVRYSGEEDTREEDKRLTVYLNKI